MPECVNITSYNKTLINELISFDNSKYNTLIILWWTGVWKTYISKHIMSDYYFFEERIFKQLCVSWQLRVRSVSELWSSLNLYPLECLEKRQKVIYDDYWTAENSPWYIEKMLYWLSRIENKNKKTIITSNLTLKELKEKDERINSRIRFNSKIIILEWDDLRVQNPTIIK